MQMTNEMKEQKGITLIALIITIIVLLILAGISINAIVGDNGVTVKAKWSDFVSEYEAVNEQKNIYRVSEQTEKYLINYKPLNNLSIEELKVFYPIKGEERNIENESNTLQKTIEKIDGREDAILYELDLGKIDQKIKRRYIVNLKTGTIYAIEGESYKGLIWHIPKIGVEKSGEELPVEKEYILTYNTKGGSPQPQEQKDKNSNGNAVFQIRNDEVTKSGYIFKCWKKKIGVDENLKDIYGEYEYQGGEDIEITENTELCAIWEKLESQYALVYNVNGGTAIGAQIYTTNEEELEVEITETIPKKNGYLFKGWSEDNTKTGEGELNAKDKITISGVKNIYAVWEDEGISGSISVKTSANKDKLLTDTKIKYSASANKSKINKIEVYFVTGQESSRVETQVYSYNLVTASNNLNNLEVKFTDLILNNVKNLIFYEDYETKLKITTSNDSVLEVTGNTIKNYTIGSANSLDKLAEVVNSGNALSGEKIEQLCNITTNNNFISIGYWDGSGDVEDISGEFFAGKYDGNNYSITIKSFKTLATHKSNGLFGMIFAGEINDLVVKGSIGSNTKYVGGIVGLISMGTLNKCTNECSLTGTSGNCHGGIVGLALDYSTIKDCTNIGSITGGSAIGGICGLVTNDVTITNCINNGNITCNETNSVSISESINIDWGTIGGITGCCLNNSKIKECQNTGTIGKTSTQTSPKGIAAGGISGYTQNSTIQNSSNRNTIYYYINSGITSNAGALGGIGGCFLESKVEQCYNTGLVTSKHSNSNLGMRNAGGVVGLLYSSEIYNCYNKGVIAGESHIGGLVGLAENTTSKICKVYNSYNSNKEFYGNSDIGGLFGKGNGVTVQYLGYIYIDGVVKSIGSNLNNTVSDIYVYQENDVKKNNSDLLKLLSNGKGSGVWTQVSGTNDWLPYLVNNLP